MSGATAAPQQSAETTSLLPVPPPTMSKSASISDGSPKPISSFSTTPVPRTTLCGARISVTKTSLKGKYSVWYPATVGGVILVDGHPYALTTSKVFLPPKPRPARGDCCLLCDQESDYALEETISSIKANSVDNTDGNGRPRRFCGRIDDDAEFVVTFMDKELRSLSRVVRLADHQNQQAAEEKAAEDARASNWKAAYVNLDYGWALIDLDPLPKDISPPMLVNKIYHQDPSQEDPEDVKNVDENNTSKTITSVKSFPTDGPPDSAHLINPWICTPNNSPEGTIIAASYDYMYFAGTSRTSRKSVLGLQYEYDAEDNGSWVVDPRRGAWWGMIVHEDRGTSYATPAEMVLENIRQSMGVEEVTLPLPPKSEIEEEEEDDEDDSQGSESDGSATSYTQTVFLEEDRTGTVNLPIRIDETSRGLRRRRPTV